MEEAGWVRGEWITKDTGRRARVYEVTAAGRKRLATEEARWQEVTSAEVSASGVARPSPV